MMRSLWTAATGMNAQQKSMDVISNNLANVNTTGYKKQRAEFQDLIYQTLRAAGSTSGTDTTYPVSTQAGHGVKLAAINRLFTQGNYQASGDPTDMVIDGDGFFQITMPDGTIGYTRDGAFKIDSTGRLVTADGYPLQPEITIPPNAPHQSITVGGDGTVSVTPAGQSAPEEVGQITIVRFVNPAGLVAQGKNIFYQSDASGDPIESVPGEDGSGTITQGYIEMSNVQVAEEMVNMIVTQRAYESNAKAITTSDSMLEIANGLKR